MPAGQSSERNSTARADVALLCSDNRTNLSPPFDSTYMDKIMMGLGEVIPDFNEESWLLPYVALGIRDFKQFKDQIGRLINERSHRKKG